MTKLLPATQAVVNAAVEAGGYGRETPVLYARLAAALRAVADQVVPKEWPTIEDYNEYEQGFAAAHIKYRNQMLAIADELKDQ